tara:strand:- start:91 stop:225 length:135 start_codon:yes stop_codon:yes gene_type:complete
MALPPISGIEPALLPSTTPPLLIDSRIGNPKPSYLDGYKNNFEK